MLKEGTFKAKAINAGLSSTKNGTGQAFVEFEINHAEGGVDHITWYGSLSEKSMEFTASALVTAGFMGTDLEDLKKDFFVTFGNPPMVSLQLKDDEYQGKKTLKVKWVNKLSQGPKKFEGQAPKMAAVFAKVRQELGVKPTTTSPTDGW